VFIFFILALGPLIEPVSASENIASFNSITGNIEFSTTGKLALPSTWRYKTVGFIVSKNSSPNLAPLESPPCTEFLPLVEKKQIDLGNGYATSYFEIPAQTIKKALEKVGINDLVSGISNVYLHAVFSTIEPGKSFVTGRYYTSYSSGSTGIMNATDNGGQLINWSNTTDELLKTNYNILTRYYEELPPDPSGIGLIDGKAEVDGDLSWRLSKNNLDSQSILQVKNYLNPSGTYIAMRNPVWAIQIDGVIHKMKELVLNPKEIKTKYVTILFTYEYTNHYYDTYQPDLVIDGKVVTWKFLKREPSWDFAKVFTYSKDLFISTKIGEEIQLLNDIRKIELLIGEKINARTNNKTQYFERFTFQNRLPVQLSTQLSIDLNYQRLFYNNDFEEKLSVNDGLKCFFPPDIDDNLKEYYSNRTSYNLGKYSINLSLSTLDSTNGEYPIAITFKDSFFITKRTGFIFSTSNSLTQGEIENKAKIVFKNTTGNDLDIVNDSILDNTDCKTRYYIPISSKTELLPGVVYENKYIIGKLGLSDITLIYSIPFIFGKFLVGSVFDNVYLNEEPAPLLDIKYPHSITILKSSMQDFKQLVKSKRFYMHGFITSDALEIDRKISSIIHRK
jgi:hypothetical protein